MILDGSWSLTYAKKNRSSPWRDLDSQSALIWAPRTALLLSLISKKRKEKAVTAYLEIPQIVAEGEVGARRLLPSYAYLPGGYETSPLALKLPWGSPDGADLCIGEFAKNDGSQSARQSGFFGQILALPQNGGPEGTNSSVGKG